MQPNEASGEGSIIARVDRDLEDLVPGFLESMREETRRLHQALLDRDFDTLRAVGHDMKGSGAGYGFEAITDLGASLERAAKAADPAPIAPLLAQLEGYLARVQVVYE